jgi:hypothetical protein
MRVSPMPKQPSNPSPSPAIRNILGRRLTRLALFFVHVTALVLACSVTPEHYFFQLGYYTGSLIIFGNIFLWALLWFGTSKPPILIFCALASVQIGILAAVGLGFRAENELAESVKAEGEARRAHYESEMAQFRMNPLFDELTGKRPFYFADLRNFQIRAQAAKAKLLELQGESRRWLAQAETRMAKRSPAAARDFRRGIDSVKPEGDKIEDFTLQYFAEVEHLTALLISHYGRYQVTRKGLIFDLPKDASQYNETIARINYLAEQSSAHSVKLKKLIEGIDAPEGR